MAITILRTAAGSSPSPSQYKLFRSLGLRQIAVDSSPLSVGFAFADSAYQVPPVDNQNYFDRLMEICRIERVDWVIPALDEELLILAQRRSELFACGVELLCSPLQAIQTCVDKLATYSFFRAHNIPTPQTWEPGHAPITEFPLIVKPRRGRGSTGVYLARSKRELDFFSEYVPDAIVQEHMSGREMTVDILADFESTPLFIRPRYRIATDSGISYKGETAEHPIVTELVTKIVGELGLTGPLNIQCFVDKSVGVWFTEINARLAGSVPLTFEADPGFARALVALLNGEKPESSAAAARPLTMLRYWSEVYLDPAGVKELCFRL